MAKRNRGSLAPDRRLIWAQIIQTGSKAPENVVVDSENGNQISIWLYQDFGDHVEMYIVQYLFGYDQSTGVGNKVAHLIFDKATETLAPAALASALTIGNTPKSEGEQPKDMSTNEFDY